METMFYTNVKPSENSKPENNSHLWHTYGPRDPITFNRESNLLGIV